MKLSVKEKGRTMLTNGEKSSDLKKNREQLDKNLILSLGKGFQVKIREYFLFRYEIGKKIGDGNFAIVYRCRMANTQSEFAMKVIDKSIMKGKVRFRPLKLSWSTADDS